MTRFWANGIHIEVWLDSAALPVRLRWDGRLHPVQAVTNRWRIDLGWWRAEPWRVWRDYYKLVTATGMLLVIYHDLISDCWYLQRVYD